MLGKPKIFLSLLAVLVLLSLTSVVYAAEDSAVNVFEFPNRLAEQLMIPLFAGQILACSIIVGLFVLPTAYTKNVIATVIVGFLALTLCVALTWLPIWIFVLICLVVALIFQDKITGIIGGSEK